MCGLVGMVGTLEYKHKNAMKDLLFLNTLRGKDSTGLTCVSRDRLVATRKLTVPGYEFLEYPFVDRAMKHADQLWMGHGRFKTSGDISRANAHPFEVLDDEGDILLVGTHNGTLNNKFDLDRFLGEKYDTDSEALFNTLVEAPNFKEAIGKLKGAWSLVWWDPTTDKLHFCRNGERPLCYAYSKDNKVLIWASEAWMIINACRRNGVELAKNENGMSCYSTNPDSLYTLNIPQEKDADLGNLLREGGYVGQPANNFQKKLDYMRQHWWDDDHPDPNYVEEPEKKTAEGKKETGKGTPEKKILTLGYPPKTGYNGENLSLAEFNKVKAKGCVWCHDPFDQAKVFAFVSDDAMVCGSCLTGGHPKDGDRVHPDTGEDEDFTDELDDDVPFDLGTSQKDSPEYTKLLTASAARAAAKTIG